MLARCSLSVLPSSPGPWPNQWSQPQSLVRVARVDLLKSSLVGDLCFRACLRHSDPQKKNSSNGSEQADDKMDVREDLMSAFNGEDDTQPFDSQPHYEDSQAIAVPVDYHEDSQYDGPSPPPLKRLKASEQLGGEATATVEAMPLAQAEAPSLGEEMVAAPLMAADVAHMGAGAEQPQIMAAQVEQMVADAAQPAPVAGPGVDHATQILEKKRATSRAWHAKWVSKGVPRPAPAVAGQVQDAGPAPVAGQDGGPVPVAGPGPDGAAAVNRPLNMRDHCARFVRRWLSESNLPPSNERRLLAYKAWMESAERAALMAGQAGVQG